MFCFEDNSVNLNLYGLKASTSAKSIGRIPSSCEDLQLIGHMKSGLYSIMGNKSIETAYCDFTKLPKQEGYILSFNVLGSLGLTISFI